jgi:hypothetical protein
VSFSCFFDHIVQRVWCARSRETVVNLDSYLSSIIVIVSKPPGANEKTKNDEQDLKRLAT